MQYQEISLKELIHYLEGSATESTRKQIDHELQHNPDFVEEFEGWEAFLEESNSREEGLAKMKSFSKEWKETKIDTAVVEPEAKIRQFDHSQIPQKEKASIRPMFLKLAIAACVLLVAAAIIWNPSQGPNVLDQVNTGITQEMDIILSPKAGNSLENMETYDVFLAGLLNRNKHSELAASLDSLLAIHPNETKYKRLQAMNFSLLEKNEEAISAFKDLLKGEENSMEFSCQVQVDLAMLYAKTQQKDAFQHSLSQLKSKEKYGNACTELDASILSKLDQLSTDF